VLIKRINDTKTNLHLKVNDIDVNSKHNDAKKAFFARLKLI